MSEPRDGTLLTLRVIVGAMAAGVVVFAAVVVLVLRPEPDPRTAEVLLVGLGALAVAEIVAWLIVGRMARRRLALRLTGLPAAEGEILLLRGFFNLVLVSVALCEAFCLFALTVYLLAASEVALLAALAGLLLLLARMPSAQSYRRFAEEMRDRRPK